MIFGFIVLGIVLMWYVFLFFPTQWVKIEHVHHDLGIKKKILHLSDIHTQHMNVPFFLIEKCIVNEQPDYIFITGDFIERHVGEFSKLQKLLWLIRESGVPAYAVLGNHDRYLRNVSVLISFLQRYNITVLQNEFIETEDFMLIGIDDFSTNHHDIDSSYSFPETDKKKIVITHDPTIVDFMEKQFDYLLAGHLHGKQINVPNLYQYKPMGPLAARGIFQGFHEMKNGPIYISKGLGQSRYNIRFRVRSEMTIHHI